MFLNRFNTQNKNVEAHSTQCLGVFTKTQVQRQVHMQDIQCLGHNMTYKAIRSLYYLHHKLLIFNQELWNHCSLQNTKLVKNRDSSIKDLSPVDKSDWSSQKKMPEWFVCWFAEKEKVRKGDWDLCKERTVCSAELNVNKCFYMKIYGCLLVLLNSKKSKVTNSKKACVHINAFRQTLLCCGIFMQKDAWKERIQKAVFTAACVRGADDTYLSFLLLAVDCCKAPELPRTQPNN